MTKSQYLKYQAAVADFMERENLTHLATGEPWCKHCDKRVGWKHKGVCPDCDEDVEYVNYPYVSSNGCDCCGDSCRQNLEFASGCDKDSGEIREYEICEQCVYYSKYGRLDDLTMMEIEEEEGEGG
jgi:hypothetical protein